MPGMINSVSCSNALSLITSLNSQQPALCWRCSMHVEYLTSGLNIHSPKKDGQKHIFVFLVWSEDHCELNIELNLRAESLQLPASWTYTEMGLANSVKYNKIHICIISKHVYPSTVFKCFQYVGRRWTKQPFTSHFFALCVRVLRKLQEILPTVDNQNATDGHIAALLVKPDMQNHQVMAHLHRKAMAGQPTPPTHLP